jgi:hypothetical protein
VNFLKAPMDERLPLLRTMADTRSCMRIVRNDRVRFDLEDPIARSLMAHVPACSAEGARDTPLRPVWGSDAWWFVTEIGYR